MIRFSMHKTISFFILFSMYAKAADQGLVTGDVQTDDKLNRMLAIPEVKALYEGCSKNKTTNGKPGDISDCVWKQVSPNKTLKDQVLKAMKDPTPANQGKPVGSLPIAENFSTDPALKKLSDIIGKRLEEALYGTPDPKDPSKKADVDQKTFNNIYRTELSKTMVDAFMSYCLDTVNSAGGSDANFKTNRDNNINALKDNAKTFLENKKADGTPDENKWNNCIANIQSDCLKKSEPQKSRACLVTQYVEAARKNITVLNATDEFYKDSKTGIRAREQSNQERDLKSLAVLTTVTSKDIDDSYKTTTEEASKKIDECIASSTEEKCKQFLNTKKDANEAGLVEFALQKNADEENFKTKVDAIGNNQEELKKFLLERGYKKETVDKIDLSNPTAVIGIIKARYTNEKEALIKEMNSRITKKTTEEEGKAGGDANKNKLTEIKRELENRTKNMQDLMVFSNVVSGYLDVQVTGSKTPAERSTASMSTELSNNDYTKKIKENIESSGTKITNPDAITTSGTETSSLDVDGVLTPAGPKQTAP